MKNGLEDYYVIKNNKKLRYGYTTGSCAAAAAKAAARMLLTGEKVENIDLMTPKGILLHLEILDIHQGTEEVSCAVRKDGGDDPDATHGLLVYAAVCKKKESGVDIDGGRGVGRVTKKGLEQPVGAAAINKMPRTMIREAVEDVADAFGYAGGFSVVISIPGGEEVAKKTFNPRLGIIGGISVLGTSGIVVPMSEDALIASIHAEMRLRKESGDYLLVTPGNYGAAFVSTYPDVDVENSVKCSNYVGETLDYAVNLGIKGILFVADIGKFIKVSGGIMNTHSREGDCRMELLTAFAVKCGVAAVDAARLLSCVTTEEAVRILDGCGRRQEVMDYAMERILFYLEKRAQGKLAIECIMYANDFGALAKSKEAEEWFTLLAQEAGQQI